MVAAGPLGRPAVAERGGISSRLFVACLLAVLAATGVARMLALEAYLADNPLAEVLFSDDYAYWREAGRMAAGAWWPDTPFRQAPGYLWALAAIRAAGGGLPAVYGLQLALGLATVALAALAARRAFGPLIGLATGVLLALADDAAWSFLRVMPDTLQLAGVTALWWQCAAPPPRGWPAAAAIGVTAGLASLAWSPALALAAVCMLWCGWQSGPRAAAAALLATALTVAPAAIHNYRADGALAPVSVNAGINLAQGNAPGARGTVSALPGLPPVRTTLFEDAARAYALAHGGAGSWHEVDAWYAGKAVAFWREHPAEALTLAARKLVWFLASSDYDNVDIRPLLEDTGLYRFTAAAPVELPWLMGMAAIGVAMMARRPRRHLPALAIVAIALAVCIVFHFSARYRLPALPVLLAAVALAFARWRPRQHGWWLAALAAGPLLAIAAERLGVTDIEPLRGDARARLAQAWLERGDARMSSGDAAAASQAWREAATVSPSPHGWQRLAWAALARDDPDGAQRWLRRADAVAPGNAATARLRYRLAARRGDRTAALAALRQAARREPLAGDVMAALAVLAAAAGDAATAERALHAALAAGAPARGYAASAWLALHDGDGERARGLAGQAAALARASGDDALAGWARTLAQTGQAPPFLPLAGGPPWARAPMRASG